MSINDPGLTFNFGVANNGASNYYFTSGSDRVVDAIGGGPNLTPQVNAGDTINFSVNVSGHPFYIKTSPTTGTGNQAPGVTNNGAVTGTISFTPATPGTYYYICQYHSSMQGQIIVSPNQVMCPAINIGALDDNSMASSGGAFAERKVNYSDMGEAIDLAIEHNFGKLDNGQFFAQPNNRMLWYEQSLTPKELKRPDFQVSTRNFFCEQESKWAFGDSNDYFYEDKERDVKGKDEYNNE